MKQYWRVGQIRTLTGLATGMLVIGKLYLPFVPVLNDMGLIGALVLGMSLFSVFLVLGWVYDVRLKMWSQDTQVTVERNAYYHVPFISSKAFDYPTFYALLSSLRGALTKVGIAPESLSSITKYLQEYYNLVPTKEDITRSLEMSEEFLKKHPFIASSEEVSEHIPLSTRAKLAWELHTLRLTWIQSLTGLIQDTLVFGALYVFIFYPDATSENSLFLAVVGISLPILIVLVALGWIYDRKFVVWSADVAVQVERNPYSYVAQPSIFAFTLPFYYALFKTLYGIMLQNGLETQRVREIISYLDEYTKLESSRSQDLNAAVQMRRSLRPLFTEEM